MWLLRIDMQNKLTNRRGPGKSIADILHQLSSADAGPAWVEFLDRYSALIMKTASQFEYRQGRSSECFLYVCEQLNDDGFRRLLKFNTAAKVKFRTWLGTVVFNLCVDWHRREFGRVTLLPAISALPAFDRAVYRLVIEQGMDKETSFQTLRADFPDLTRELIESSVIRVFSLLTPRQRWQVSVRNRRRQQASGNSYQGQVEHLTDPGTGPEVQAQKQQDLDRMQDALNRLPSSQRLLLRLRFQEGLSLKRIAELGQLGDTSRAWRHLQAALKALVQNMKTNPCESRRKT